MCFLAFEVFFALPTRPAFHVPVCRRFGFRALHLCLRTARLQSDTGFGRFGVASQMRIRKPLDDNTRFEPPFRLPRLFSAAPSSDFQWGFLSLIPPRRRRCALKFVLQFFLLVESPSVPRSSDVSCEPPSALSCCLSHIRLTVHRTYQSAFPRIQIV